MRAPRFSLLLSISLYLSRQRLCGLLFRTGASAGSPFARRSRRMFASSPPPSWRSTICDRISVAHRCDRRSLSTRPATPQAPFTASARLPATSVRIALVGACAVSPRRIGSAARRRAEQGARARAGANAADARCCVAQGGGGDRRSFCSVATSIDCPFCARVRRTSGALASDSTLSLCVSRRSARRGANVAAEKGASVLQSSHQAR